MAPVTDAGRRPVSVYQFVGFAIRKIWRTMCVTINGHGMTLIFDFGGHGACDWRGSSSSIRIPSLKFVGLAVRKRWRTMCVSINGPSDLDLWPFDLETGTRVTSKVGNLHSEIGYAKPSGSRVIRYARDGRTDGQKQLLTGAYSEIWIRGWVYQPKLNLIHFSLKIWHLVATILMIFPRVKWPILNFHAIISYFSVTNIRPNVCWV